MRKSVKIVNDVMLDFYEDDWPRSEELQTCLQEQHRLWSIFEGQVHQIRAIVRQYELPFPDTEKRIEKRKNKLLDYDSALRHVKNLYNDPKSSQEDKAKAEKNFEEKEQIYQEKNQDLITDLRQIIEGKLDFMMDCFPQLTSAHQEFFSESVKAQDNIADIFGSLPDMDVRVSIIGRPGRDQVQSAPLPRPQDALKNVTKLGLSMMKGALTEFTSQPGPPVHGQLLKAPQMAQVQPIMHGLKVAAITALASQRPPGSQKDQIQNIDQRRDAGLLTRQISPPFEDADSEQYEADDTEQGEDVLSPETSSQCDQPLQSFRRQPSKKSHPLSTQIKQAKQRGQGVNQQGVAPEQLKGPQSTREQGRTPQMSRQLGEQKGKDVSQQKQAKLQDHPSAGKNQQLMPKKQSSGLRENAPMHEEQSKQKAALPKQQEKVNEGLKNKAGNQEGLQQGPRALQQGQHTSRKEQSKQQGQPIQATKQEMYSSKAGNHPATAHVVKETVPSQSKQGQNRRSSVYSGKKSTHKSKSPPRNGKRSISKSKSPPRKGKTSAIKTKLPPSRGKRSTSKSASRSVSKSKSPAITGKTSAKKTKLPPSRGKRSTSKSSSRSGRRTASKSKSPGRRKKTSKR